MARVFEQCSDFSKFNLWIALVCLVVASGCGGGDDDAQLTGWTPESCDSMLDDDGDGLIDCADPDCYPSAVCIFVPPNPVDVAPDLPLNGVVSYWERNRWLFEQADGVQRGLTPGVITPNGISTVVTQIVGRSGQPVEGVSVSLVNRPEFGRTYSRADGKLDLAFEAEGQLVLRVRKDGYVPVDRILAPQPQNGTSLQTIVLSPLSEPTLVTFENTQFVAGPDTQDADGARKTALIIPKNTKANMVFPDGSKAPLGQMNLRTTEVTVGEDGPQAMMAELPATTLYTYASEFTVDEAVKAQATHVEFETPVYVYIDNFIGFEPGVIVPSGSYDRSTARWKPEPNGMVIEVVSTDGGKATIAGGNGAFGADELATLGVSSDELKLIAKHYAIGDTIWRVPVLHFSAFDMNWLGDVLDDLLPPAPAKRTGDCTSGQEAGSIISCDSMSLRESIPLAGTPFSLNYHSTRTLGRKPVLEVPVLPSTVEALDSLVAAQVRVTIAGQQMETREYLSRPEIPRITEYVWDGLDQYGRRVQGGAEAEVEVTAIYLAPYVSAGGDVEFLKASGIDEIPPLFGAYSPADGTDVLSGIASSRAVYGARRTYVVGLRNYDIAREDLGGWSVNLQHRYDPMVRTMYYGSGLDRSAGDQNTFMRAVTTKGLGGLPEVLFNDGAWEGERALDHPELSFPSLGYPQSFTLGRDGTIYLGIDRNILSINPTTNIVTRVAGIVQSHIPSLTEDETETGDGGLAVDAKLDALTSVKLGGDGLIYFTTQEHFWQLDNDGILHQLRGDPDKEADILNPITPNLPIPIWDVGRDGTVIYSDAVNLYEITTSNEIRVINGNSDCCPQGVCGEGENVIDASICHIESVQLGPNGDIFFLEYDSSEKYSYVRRVLVDGTVKTHAEIEGVGHGLKVAPDGRVFLAGIAFPSPVLNLGSIIEVKEGGELFPYVGFFANLEEDDIPQEDLFPTQADMDRRRVKDRAHIYQIEISPAGDFYVIGKNFQILKIDALYPEYSDTGYEIAQPGGAAVDVFSADGCHLRTHDALTGTTIWEFDYDTDGRLLTATDLDGNVTTIKRAPDGRPQAIVGPDGSTWTLDVDSEGMMIGLASPESDLWKFEYDAGLLTTMSNPRDDHWVFDYDEAGRLIRDEQPHGGASTLEKGVAQVTFTSAAGRETVYKTTPPGSTGFYKSKEQGELKSETRNSRLWDSKTEGSDGTVSARKSQPHPLFGMIASYTSGTELVTPAGLKFNTESTLNVVGADEGKTSGLESLESMTTDGTSEARTTWELETGTLRTESGMGRWSERTLDSEGRLTQVAAAGVTPAILSYDARGRLVGTSQGARSTTITYDSNGFVDSVIGADGTTSFSRDLMGRITSGTRVDGSIAYFGYDKLSQLVEVTPPDAAAYTMTQDVRGNLMRMTTPDGHITTMDYDMDYRLRSYGKADGRTMSVTYDSSNRVDTMSVDGDLRDFQYAATGQLALLSGGDANLAYTWDGPLPLTQTYSGAVEGVIGWTWEDGTLRLAEADINGTAISYEYDEDGLPITIGKESISYQTRSVLLKKREVDAIESVYTENDFGELERMRSRDGSTDVLDLQYTYDDLGRILTISEEYLNTTDIAYGYEYDELGQLTGVTVDGAQASSYSYDQNGNRIAVTCSGLTLSEGSITYSNDDEMLTHGALSMTYNDAGQLATINGSDMTFSYGMLGELERVGLGGTGDTLEYEHDATGRRIARRLNGAYTNRYLYSGNINPVAEVDASGNTTTVYVYGTGLNVPDYMERGGKTYYFVRDHLGSVRLVIDTADGTVAQSMSYDEFGRVESDSNPGFQPFGYAGGLYEPLTGLTRFGVRDYFAEIGRWTAPDPIGFGGGQLNLYVYVNNNPVNFVDWTGKSFGKMLAGGIIGAIGGANVNSFDMYTQGNDRLGDAAEIGAAGGFIGGAVGGALMASPTLALFVGGAIGGGLVETGNQRHGLTQSNNPGWDIAKAAGTSGLICAGVGITVQALTVETVGVSGLAILGETGVAGYRAVANFFWNFDQIILGRPVN